MPAIARTALATLSLSAKLHKLLDQMGVQQQVAFNEEVNSFDTELDRALFNLENQKGGVVRAEARSEEFTLLKRDFQLLERFYQEMRAAEQVPEDVGERFSAIFSELREKIKEKELTI